MRLTSNPAGNRLRTLAPFALLGVMTVVNGCVVETTDTSGCDCGAPYDPGVGGTGGGSSQSPDVVLATIDVGETLEAEPGAGIGLFIEVAEGGRWHVFATCDTELSGLGCEFNVLATVQGGYASHVAGEGLEAGDGVYEYEDGIELDAVARSDFDGMTFDAPAGATVRFELYLDGQKDARFIYWVGGGALHGGAPTNPIDLKPGAE